MRGFSVILERNGKILQYFVKADRIEYTTQTVYLLSEESMVAYFKRDYVFSITEQEKTIFDEEKLRELIE